MVNYNNLPLFPLNVVLYPQMPLPLHIFEARYREMILHCRETNSPFGVVLISDGSEVGAPSAAYSVGTTARITQFDTRADGCMDIVVEGDTRFRIEETHPPRPYLSARVAPFWEQTTDPLLLQAPFDRAAALFKTYLQHRFSRTGRVLSALQLPQEPELLSYAIASVMEIDLREKQRLLGLITTETRLVRLIDLLTEEIDAQRSLHAIEQEIEENGAGVVVPVDRHALGRLSGRN